MDPLEDPLAEVHLVDIPEEEALEGEDPLEEDPLKEDPLMEDRLEDPLDPEMDPQEQTSLRGHGDGLFS